MTPAELLRLLLLTFTGAFKLADRWVNVSIISCKLNKMCVNSGALRCFCLCHFFVSGSFKIPAYLDAPFKSSGKCPVVIFSHGLGAFRYPILNASFSSASADGVTDVSLLFPQDFVFSYMCRIGLGGLRRGVRGTQVRSPDALFTTRRRRKRRFERLPREQ